MKYLEELKEMLCEELEKIGKKGELSAGSLETVHKLTDTIKNIGKIEMQEEEMGYSEARYSRDGGMSYGGGSSYDEGGNSYARGRGRNAKRDSMGRYSREGGNYSMENRGGQGGGSRGGNRGGYSREGYSRDGAKDYMMEQLEEIMESAGSEKERNAIRQCMHQLEAM